MTITIDTTGHDSPTAVLRAHAAYQLVLTEHVCAGSRLFRIEGELTHTPTRYSVQVDQDLHIDIPSGYAPDETLDRFYWRFTNHSRGTNAARGGGGMYARDPLQPRPQ